MGAAGGGVLVDRRAVAPVGLDRWRPREFPGVAVYSTPERTSKLTVQVQHADTTFLLANVHANAEALGRAAGVEGPYFFKYRKDSLDTWTHVVGGHTYTISERTRQQIIDGSMGVEELMAGLFATREIAYHLHRKVRRMHETAEIRATAYDMEFRRVTVARQASAKPVGR